MIPAWLISLSAIAAAICILTVRPMPLLIRLSIAVPCVYFSIIYLWAAVTPIDAVIRTDIIRIGLLLLFFPMILNSVMVRIEWFRRGRKL